MDKFYLLADDDHDDAESFGEALAEMEYPVTFHHVKNVHGLLQFLDIADNKTPDIIFLDLNMPKISGW
jgi:CheY-like chemotaxis protein